MLRKLLINQPKTSNLTPISTLGAGKTVCIDRHTEHRIHQAVRSDGVGSMLIYEALVLEFCILFDVLSTIKREQTATAAEMSEKSKQEKD